MKRLTKLLILLCLHLIYVDGSSWGVARCVYAQSALPSGERPLVKRTKVFKVFGSDDRQEVADTSVFPWSAVGMIEAYWGAAANYEIRGGTGVLISDRVVLTCAHVLHESGIGWADRVSFIPGKSGDSEPFGTIQVSTLTARDEWIDHQDDNYDIALLVLSSPVGQQVGHMNAVGKPVSFFTGRSLNMSGYPSDLVWDRLYNGVGDSRRVEGHEIVHYIDGGPGQSGGPVWYVDDTTGEHTVVGVYTGDIEVTNGGGQVVDEYGVAIQINATLCQWISAFLAEHDPDAPIHCEGATDGTIVPGCGTGTVGCASGVAGTLPLMLVGLGVMRGFRQRFGP